MVMVDFCIFWLVRWGCDDAGYCDIFFLNFLVVGRWCEDIVYVGGNEMVVVVVQIWQV